MYYYVPMYCHEEACSETSIHVMKLPFIHLLVLLPSSSGTWKTHHLLIKTGSELAVLSHKCFIWCAFIWDTCFSKCFCSYIFTNGSKIVGLLPTINITICSLKVCSITDLCISVLVDLETNRCVLSHARNYHYASSGTLTHHYSLYSISTYTYFSW